MSLWRSSPDGHRVAGWRRMMVVALACSLAPAMLGAALATVVNVLGPERMGDSFLVLGTYAMIAMLSPLLALPFYALVGLAAWALMRRGAFGWVPVLILGGVGGSVIATSTGHDLMIPAGAFLALLYRQTIAVLVPGAV